MTMKSPTQTVEGLTEELIAWLMKRAAPDSGIDYAHTWYSEATSRQHPSRVTIFGDDAEFIAKHFHGKGAAVLASTLTDHNSRAEEADVDEAAKYKADAVDALAMYNQAEEDFAKLEASIIRLSDEDRQLLRMIAPFVDQRSREPGDAWNKAAAIIWLLVDCNDPIAFSPSYPAAGVRVKALDWVERGKPTADTIVGTYRASHDGDEPDEWSFELNGRLGRFLPSEVEAKAAAQAHFDAAILSAVEQP